jgi:chromosome segregation ATPase
VGQFCERLTLIFCQKYLTSARFGNHPARIQALEDAELIPKQQIAILEQLRRDRNKYSHEDEDRLPPRGNWPVTARGDLNGATRLALWSASAVPAISARFTNAEQRLVTKQAELGEVSTQLVAKQAEVADADQRLADAERRLAPLQEQLAAILSQIEDANKQRRTAQQAAETVVKRVNELKAESELARKLLSDRQTEAEAAEQRRRLAERQVSELREERTSLTAMKAELETKLPSLIRDLETLRGRRDAAKRAAETEEERQQGAIQAEKRLAALRGMVQEAEQRIIRLTRQKAVLDAERANLIRENELLTHRRYDASQTAEREEIRARDLATQNVDVERRLVAIKGEVELAEQRRQTLNQSLGAARNQINSVVVKLEEVLGSFEGSVAAPGIQRSDREQEEPQEQRDVMPERISETTVVTDAVPTAGDEITGQVEEHAKRTLTLDGDALALRRPAETGQVRQPFSHGRSKVVTVEVRKKRLITPGAPTEGSPAEQSLDPGDG